MSFLLDTNVLSEVGRGTLCHPSVRAWYEEVDADDLRLSVLVVGEIRRGIERLRGREEDRAARLDAWLDSVVRAFAERVLPVDRRVAEEWGRMSAARTVPVVDGLLAATARVHGLTLVTRNVADVRDLGASLWNPFETSSR